jgi:hypothetical protein
MLGHDGLKRRKAHDQILTADQRRQRRRREVPSYFTPFSGTGAKIPTTPRPWRIRK